MASPNVQPSKTLLRSLNQGTRQVERTIYVTSISSKASIKSLSDLFTFCGTVEKISLDGECALVTFEKDSAYQTALMLSGAMVEDQAIQVFSLEDIVTNNDGTSRNRRVEGDRTASSVATNLFNEGYFQGEAAWNKVKLAAAQLDQRMQISQAVGRVNESLSKFNQDYGITDTVTGLGELSLMAAKSTYDTVSQKFARTYTDVGTKVNEFNRNLDEKYKIKEKSQRAKKDFEQSIQVGGKKLKEGATTVTFGVVSGVSTLDEKLGTTKTIKAANEQVRNKFQEMKVDEKLNHLKGGLSTGFSSGWNFVKSTVSNISDQAQRQLREARGDSEGVDFDDIDFDNHTSDHQEDNEDDEYGLDEDDLFSRPDISTKHDDNVESNQESPTKAPESTPEGTLLDLE